MNHRIATFTLAFAVALASPLAAVLVPVASAATPAQEAEDLIRRGISLRRVGDEAGALPLLQRAYELHRSPRTAVQLGLVEYALGRWADADEHLTEAYKYVETDSYIQKNRKEIEDWLRTVKKQVARVEITGEPVGAEVLVNGRLVGTVPLARAVAVSAGGVDIELRAPGHKSAFRTLTLTGGQYQPIVMRLQREGGGERNDYAASPPAADEGEPAPVAASSQWRKWTVVSLVGGAAIGAGLGAYGVLRHDSKVEAFDNANCREFMGMGRTAAGAMSPLCTSRYNDIQTARKLAIIGFSAAGALAATALILHLTAPDPASAGNEYAHRRPPVCVPDLPGRGVTCALSF